MRSCVGADVMPSRPDRRRNESANRRRVGVIVGLILLLGSTGLAVPHGLDAGSPKVSIAPPTGHTVSGELNDPDGSECEALASDSDGINRVDFAVDGTFLNSDYRAPYTCRWETRDFPNGQHELSATVVDAGGNRSMASVTVDVENRLSQVGTEAGLLWSGDAETGDLSQWSSASYSCEVDGTVYHDVEHCADRIRVVGSPTSGSHSRYAYRFEVGDGDVSPWGGERNEIKQRDSDKVYPRGSERWFGYSVLLPSSFPRDDQGLRNDWTAFSGWKTVETHGSGPAAINMQTGDDQLSLKHASSPSHYLWRSPVVRDRWQRFVVRIKFDPDPNVGFVEMWKDGQLVLPKTYTSTMETYNGYVDPTYSKIGYYRNEAISGTSAIYIDDYKVGTSYADVVPGGSGDTGGDTSAPAAPAGLAATGGDASVALDWADNSEADLAAYEVHRTTTPGGPYTKVASTIGSAYTDTGLSNGTSYYYVVVALDSSGNASPGSSEVSSTPVDSAGLFTLSGSGFKNKGWRYADLSWKGSSSATHIDVYRDGTKVAERTANDGWHRDRIAKGGSGSNVYRICEAGSTTGCSNETTVTIG